MPSVRPSTWPEVRALDRKRLDRRAAAEGLSRAPSSCSISWLVAFVQERRSSPGSFTKSPGIYSEGVRSYEQWQRERAENAAWVAAVDRALGPYRRERPRDPEEAALLRELGTPEELIGPIREEPRPGDLPSSGGGRDARSHPVRLTSEHERGQKQERAEAMRGANVREHAEGRREDRPCPVRARVRVSPLHHGVDCGLKRMPGARRVTSSR